MNADFFFNMTPREAEAYFRAYVESHPKRVEEFRQKVAMEGGPPLEELDYSPESLVPVWTWMMPRIRRREDPPREDEEGIEWAYPGIYTAETIHLFDGLAAYLAETILRNIPGIHWTIGHRPGKRHIYIYERQPVLAGFKGGIERSPRETIWYMAGGALDGNPRKNRPESLLEAYRIWKGEISFLNLKNPDGSDDEANQEITIRAGKLEVGLYRDDPEAPGIRLKGYDRYDLFFDDDAYIALEDDYDWSEARFDAMDAQLYAKLAELEPRVGVIWEDKEVFFVFIPQEVKDPVGLIKKAVRAMVLRPVPEVELTWWKKMCEERAENILKLAHEKN